MVGKNILVIGAGLLANEISVYLHTCNNVMVRSEMGLPGSIEYLSDFGINDAAYCHLMRFNFKQLRAVPDCIFNMIAEGDDPKLNQRVAPFIELPKKLLYQFAKAPLTIFQLSQDVASCQAANQNLESVLHASSARAVIGKLQWVDDTGYELRENRHIETIVAATENLAQYLGELTLTIPRPVYTPAKP